MIELITGKCIGQKFYKTGCFMSTQVLDIENNGKSTIESAECSTKAPIFVWICEGSKFSRGY